MMWQRIVTAIVVLPCILALLLFTSAPLFTFISGLLFWAAAWEWARLSEFQSPWYVMAYVIFFGLALVGIQRIPTSYHHLMFGMGFLLWSVLMFWTVTYKGTFPRLLQQRGSRALIGFLVLAFAWFGILQIRLQPKGVQWILCLIAIVGACDTAAYFAGRLLGKRLFSPLISPKKTWAGFWGGLIGALGVSLLCFWLMAMPQAQWSFYFVMAVLITLLAIYGDLFESLVKRIANQKDSGTLLPGHGGLLDRLDSFLPTMPVFAWYLIQIR